MSDAYHTLAIFDDLAFAALKVSLAEPDRSIIIERLSQDWMTDEGIIGLLRRQHIETKSLEAPAQVYWESRREPLSPRIESLLASVLINLASSMVFEFLRGLVAGEYDLSGFLQERGANVRTIIGFSGDIQTLTEHARILMRLYRAKEDQRRADEVRRVVQDVLAGQKITIADASADRATELLLANLVPTIQGVIKEELKKSRVYVADEADAVLSKGLPAAPGFGIGVPVLWKDRQIELIPPFVLLTPNTDASNKPDLRRAIEQSVAVVAWNGGMTSHIAVACRTIGRPAVLVSAPEADMLRPKKFLVVDGSSGTIRSYHHPPPPVESGSTATPMRTKPKHRRAVRTKPKHRRAVRSRRR
jgi:phosphohistidine swiveling domain-containing protein